MGALPSALLARCAATPAEARALQAARLRALDAAVSLQPAADTPSVHVALRLLLNCAGAVGSGGGGGGGSSAAAAAAGGGGEALSALRLKEIGPRLTLRLVKIESGMCEGEVLHHAFVEKSGDEVTRLAERAADKLAEATP